ncbi:MAG: autotransporter outer membrane beta-barrel domain-containing protein, partial [bacterium]|nr:autotransporter outer membrane beta-barrel domain-containing protein [bacterium]
GDLQLEGKLNLTSDRMTATTATIENRGIIAVDIESATTPEPLDLSSTLTLEAGSVDVAFDSTYGQGLVVGDTDHFTIAESDVAITTRLSGGEDRDGIRFKTAIFDLELLYDDARCSGANNVCLQTIFAPILEDDADTNSQREIAHALDLAYACAQNPGLPQCGIDSDTADDFNDLYGNFAVSSRDIPDILDAVAPEEYGAIADMRAAAAARFNRSISRRFDLELTEPKSDEGDAEKNAPETNPAVSAGPRSKPLGANARNYRDSRAARMPWRRRAPPGPMPIDRHAGKGGFTSWLDVHGVMGELDGGKKFEDVDYRIYGPLFGLDYGITDTVTAGVTLGYTRNELKTPGAEDKATANSYQGGAYVGAVFEDFYVTGAARYAYGDFETRRRIRFRSIDRTATADFETSDVSAFLEAAYDVPIPQWPWIPDNTIVQPQVALAYSHLVQSSFDESDAGSLNLEVDKQELDALQSSIGVRVALRGRDSEKRYLLPQLRIAYEREWLDKDRPIDAHLPAAGSGGDVKIDGIELPRDRAVIGVSSEVGVSDRVNLFVDYDLRAAQDLLEHSLAFGLRAIW